MNKMRLIRLLLAVTTLCGTLVACDKDTPDTPKETDGDST